MDSGETEQIPQQSVALPNLGMWTKAARTPHLWTTIPVTLPTIPTPCGQPPRLSPSPPPLSTCTYTLLSTLCAAYPQRSKSYPQIHRQIACQDVRTHSDQHAGHPIGENQGRVGIVYEGTVASYPACPYSTHDSPRWLPESAVIMTAAEVTVTTPSYKNSHPPKLDW